MLRRPSRAGCVERRGAARPGVPPIDKQVVRDKTHFLGGIQPSPASTGQRPRAPRGAQSRSDGCWTRGSAVPRHAASIRPVRQSADRSISAEDVPTVLTRLLKKRAANYGRSFTVWRSYARRIGRRLRSSVPYRSGQIRERQARQLGSGLARCRERDIARIRSRHANLRRLRREHGCGTRSAR